MQTVLITGAASGIGASFARILARKGYNLFLFDKDAEQLAELAYQLHERYPRVVCRFSARDLSHPQAVDHIIGDLLEQGIMIDVLVNNVGIGCFGEFWQSDAERISALLNLNVVLPVKLTLTLLPRMIREGSGGIINVSSMAHLLPGPLDPTYYASKAFLYAFSVSLAFLVQGKGVRCTAVCPGPTKTGFNEGKGSDNKKTTVPTLLEGCGSGGSGGILSG